MTRDEHRSKAIEAMAENHWNSSCSPGHTSINSRPGPSILWDKLMPVFRAARIRDMTAAFDSLHGVAFVDPTEATEEMIKAGWWNAEYEGQKAPVAELYRIMAAAGDLTNPPETP
jgi:hypothetical protein